MKRSSFTDFVVQIFDNEKYTMTERVCSLFPMHRWEVSLVITSKYLGEAGVNTKVFKLITRS